jgi:hypothetical protein
MLQSIPHGKTVTIRATPTAALQEQKARAEREAAMDWEPVEEEIR